MHSNVDSRNNGVATCSHFLVVVRKDGTQTPARANLDFTFPLSDPANSNAQSPCGFWRSTLGHVSVQLWPAHLATSTGCELKVVSGGQVSVGARRAGRYCEIELDTTGRGFIRQDPCGLHPLYFATIRDTTIIADQSHLVALAYERLTGRAPGRDRCFAAWLALAGYPIGNRTGYEDIHCVPFASAIHVRSDYQTEIRSEKAPWLLDKARDIERHVDQVESELIENLRTVVTGASHRPLLQLTGGRDSRLVLALAARGAMLNDVEIVTYGPPEKIDAVVARELTSKLGVPHTQLRWNNRAVTDLCGHVYKVAGALNCWDSTIAPCTDDRLSLSGLVGEAIRSTWPVHQAGLSCLKSVVNAYLSAYSGGTYLLRRDASVAALRYGLECLLEPAARTSRFEDFLDAFSVQHRIRRRVSVRPMRFSREFFPLYHPPAVELAFGIGSVNRMHGYIHNDIIRRAGGPIYEVDYCNPRGRYRLSDRGVVTDEDDRRLEQRSFVPRFFGRLRGRKRRQVHEEVDIGRYERYVAEEIDKNYRLERSLPLRRRSDLTHQPLGRQQSIYKEFIHANQCNPMFDEIVDRERLLMCVERLPELTHSGRLRVHGAMTGVVWLGGLEKESSW